MHDEGSIRRQDEAAVSRDEKDIVGLCREMRRGGITRRHFMERALLLGLSATAVGALAGACGEETPGEGEKGTLPPMDETKPAELTLYNWTDYLDPSIKKDFQKAQGIKVREVFFSSNEEMLAKMRAGAKGYDVIVPSDYMVHIMIKSGLLEPLDLGFLPNYQYIGDRFKDPPYDDPAENNGLQYSVPYFYGTTGYVRRTDKIAEELTDWTPLFDPANAGKINMLDDERECLGAALKSLGYSLNTLEQSELDEATAKLIEQKPLVAVYDSVNMKRAIVQGQPLVMCWDGDALMGIDALGGDAQAKALVAFVRPTEGFMIWDDTLVCPVGNNSRYGAHLWMDYLMDPKVAGKNASWVWYLSAVAPASWDYTDEFALSLTPTDDELARAEVANDVGEFATAYSEAWRQVKSA
jgi:spermidine/putrescine transport system substrate-binding protein